MRFLDKGEHLDLCIVVNKEAFCFAEHFDSSVLVCHADYLLNNKFQQQLKQSPIVTVKNRYSSEGDKQNAIDFSQYLLDKNATIDINRDREVYEVRIGTKGGNSFHVVGCVDVDIDGEFNMIFSTRNKKDIVMTLYHVVIGQEFTCEKLDEKIVTLSETKGFVLPCSEDEMKEFLKKDEGILPEQREMFRIAVLDCYSYYPNYPEKFQKFQSCFYLGWQYTNTVEMFFLNYWFSKPDFYNFAEICIARNEQDEIIKNNPYYTGRMPSAKELVKLNAKADAIAKQMSLSKETINALAELQNYPNVGADGINLILDFLLKSTSANEDRDYDRRIKVCDNHMYWMIPGYLLKIFETFDITPKQFIDRTIRELFYNNMNVEEYWRCIRDYVNMCEQLNMEVDKKLPKDLMHRHDILSTRVREIKDAAIKQQFAIMVAANKKLIEKLPQSNFTIISPETSKDLIEEGFRMNHCVGTYAYSYASGNSKIFFIRDKANVDIPIATLELDHKNRLVQVQAHSNRTPDKAVMQFVNDWLDMLRKEGN